MRIVVIAVVAAMAVLGVLGYHSTSEGEAVYEPLPTMTTTTPLGFLDACSYLWRVIRRPRNEPHECGLSFSYPRYTLVGMDTEDTEDTTNNLPLGDSSSSESPASGIDPFSPLKAVRGSQGIGKPSQGPNTPTSMVPEAGFQLLEFEDNTADATVKGGLYTSLPRRSVASNPVASAPRQGPASNCPLQHNHRDVPILFIPGNCGSFYDSRGFGRSVAHQVMNQATRVGLGMLVASRDGEDVVSHGIAMAEGRGISTLLHHHGPPSVIGESNMSSLCQDYCGGQPVNLSHTLCYFRCMLAASRRATVNNAEMEGRSPSTASLLGVGVFAIGMREMYLVHTGSLILRGARHVSKSIVFLYKQFMIFHCTELTGTALADEELRRVCAHYIDLSPAHSSRSLRREYEASIVTHLQRQLCAGTAANALFRSTAFVNGDRSVGASPYFRNVRKLLATKGRLSGMVNGSYGGDHPLGPTTSLCAHLTAVAFEEAADMDTALVSTSEGNQYILRRDGRGGGQGGGRSLQRQLTKEVLRFHRGGMWVVGHSLGGTVARLGVLLALSKKLQGNSGGVVVAGMITLSASNLFPPIVADWWMKTTVYGSGLHGVGKGAMYVATSNGSISPRIPHIGVQGGPTDVLVYSPSAAMSVEMALVAQRDGFNVSNTFLLKDVPHYQLRGCGVGATHNGVVYCRQSLPSMTASSHHGIGEPMLRLINSDPDTIENSLDDAYPNFVLPPRKLTATPPPSATISWLQVPSTTTPSVCTDDRATVVVMATTNLMGDWVREHLVGLDVGNGLRHVMPSMVLDVPYRTIRDTTQEATTDMYDGPSNDWMDRDGTAGGGEEADWVEKGPDGPIHFHYSHDGVGEEEVTMLAKGVGRGVSAKGSGYPQPATTIRPFVSWDRVPLRSIRTVVVFKLPCSSLQPINSSPWSLMGDIEVPSAGRFRSHLIEVNHSHLVESGVVHGSASILPTSFFPGTLLQTQLLHPLQFRGDDEECVMDGRRGDSQDAVLQELQRLNTQRLEGARMHLRPPVPSPLMVVTLSDLLQVGVESAPPPPSLRLLLSPNTPASALEDETLVTGALARLDAHAGSDGWSRRCVVANGSQPISVRRRYIRNQLPVVIGGPQFEDSPMLALPLDPFPPAGIPDTTPYHRHTSTIPTISSTLLRVDHMDGDHLLPTWAVVVERVYLRMLRSVHLVITYQVAPASYTSVFVCVLLSIIFMRPSSASLRGVHWVGLGWSTVPLLPILISSILQIDHPQSIWQTYALSTSWSGRFGWIYLPSTWYLLEAYSLCIGAGTLVILAYLPVHNALLWAVAYAVEGLSYPIRRLIPFLWISGPSWSFYLLPVLVFGSVVHDYTVAGMVDEDAYSPVIFNTIAVPVFLVWIGGLCHAVWCRCQILRGLSPPRSLFPTDACVYLSELCLISSVSFMSVRNVIFSAIATVMTSKARLPPVRGAAEGLSAWEVVVTAATGRTDGLNHWGGWLGLSSGGSSAPPYRMPSLVEGQPAVDMVIGVLLIAIVLVIQIRYSFSSSPGQPWPVSTIVAGLYIWVEFACYEWSLLLVPVEGCHRVVWRGVPTVFCLLVGHLVRAKK